MTRSSVIRLVSCFVATFLTGACATLPVYKNLSPGVAIEASAPVAETSPFAPDPAGEKVAVVQNGLALLDTVTGIRTPLSPDGPDALAWTADGQRLAAVYSNGHGSDIRIYESRGHTVGMTTITGDACAMLWRGNELLIATLELKIFSFGANFRQVLYRWDGAKPPVSTELYNSTLRLKVYKRLAPSLRRLFTISLSPYDDTIVYSRLMDPPSFSPYLHFILRNLATGSERDVASASVDSGGAVFAGTDDRMLYGDGTAVTVLLDPWHEKNLATYPHSGRSLASSGGGNSLFIDGNLYNAERLMVTFPADATGHFNSDGTRLFVKQGKQLFVVSGLPADPPPPVPADNPERFLTLRQWRSQGLITPVDFRKATERIPKP